MGLYMNKDNHPDVYKNEGNIKESNQSYYEYNVFSEMIDEQKKINDSLRRSFQQLSQRHMNDSQIHAAKWEEVNQNLNQISNGNRQRQLFESEIMNQFRILQEKDQQVEQILESEAALKQDLINRINEINLANQNVFHQLAKHESFEIHQAEQIKEIQYYQEQLMGQMTKQEENQEQLMNQMTTQKDHQDDVLNKLESHEALIQKTLRQLHHLRSIIFERSSYLADKIEESYDLTSTYIYKYLTSSEQPLTLYLANQQKKQNKNKGEE